MPRVSGAPATAKSLKNGKKGRDPAGFWSEWLLLVINNRWLFWAIFHTLWWFLKILDVSFIVLPDELSNNILKPWNEKVMNQDKLRIQLIGLKRCWWGILPQLQRWPRLGLGVRDSAWHCVRLQGDWQPGVSRKGPDPQVDWPMPASTGDMSVEHPEMAVDKCWAFGVAIFWGPLLLFVGGWHCWCFHSWTSWGSAVGKPLTSAPSPSHHHFFEWYKPSPNGRFEAFGLPH